jgi:SAM-dependent methyltransferase
MTEAVLDRVRAQATALEPRFAACGGRSVLEVGAGRWASSFDLAETRFVGVNSSQDMIDTARAIFPEGAFDHLGPELLFPYDEQSFDIVFGVDVMRYYLTPAKRTLVSEMWRVARPGACLILLEDFVFEKRSTTPGIYPMPVLEFVDLILEATAGQVVLEHVESLRYPADDLVRAAVISLTRLGVPKT